MKAFVIAIEGHAYSQEKARACIRSAVGVDIEVFPAVDRAGAHEVMRKHGLGWTWANGNTSPAMCPVTGLNQRPYGKLDAKIGCSMSHYLLWQRCVEIGEPILILEHDAVFLRAMPEFEFDGICQINDPEGATPRGKWWHDQMVKRGSGVHAKTQVLPNDVPDGLAGNSAYVVKPFAASELMDAFRALGVWPNDATMCRQLFPYLQELYPFVTRVEQTMSTTCQ